jgi:DNA sulfur modification protein DndB
LKSIAFKGLVEMERSTLSERSRKLFTLSAIYTGCHALLDAKELADEDIASKLCITFWDEVSKHIPEWEMVQKSRLTAGEIRKELLHSHGIAIQSIGVAGSQLLAEHPKDWKQKLEAIKSIDWSRSNAKLWEGRALQSGRVSKTHTSVTLTTNLIKQKLGLKLAPEEKRTEEAYKRGEDGRKEDKHNK